jgi:hypothetical protein
MSGTTMSLILRNLVELFNKISILHDPFICVFSVKACWFYHFFVLSTATLKVILATMLLVRRGKIQRSSLEIPWLVYTSCLQWWFLRLLCPNFFSEIQFIAGCGKFFEGTAEQMYQSLIVTLGSLPKSTRVYCGHEVRSLSLFFHSDSISFIKEELEC